MFLHKLKSHYFIAAIYRITFNFNNKCKYVVKDTHLTCFLCLQKKTYADLRHNIKLLFFENDIAE